MPTQDDIMDVLGLAKSLNSEIHEYNRNNMDPRTNINIITPQNVMKNVPVPVAQIPQPPIRQMMDVGGVPVAAPIPLIPLAEAFPDGKIPDGYTAQPLPQPSMPQQAPIPPKNDNQLEFSFAQRIEQRPDAVQAIHHRFDDIEQKLILLDAKISNLFGKLFDRKRRKKEEGSNGTVA